MIYDVLVIGAGPAGLAAATTAARNGATVALLDNAVTPGGQYLRQRRGDPSGADRAFRRLTARLEAVDHLTEHRVWAIRPGHPFTAHAVAGIRNTRPTTFRADTVVLATGAHDRQLPFPGWQLPGVYTAGAVQALYKGDGVTVPSDVVVAGTGPFLLPVATGLARAGATVAGVYEANRPSRDLLRSATNSARAAEAGGYLATLARHRIGYHIGQTVVAAHGDDRLESVTVARVDRHWRVRDDTTRRIPCRSLAVGYGFTPNLDLATTLGAALTEAADGTPAVAVSATQRTSVPGVYAAGEITGVGGAALAAVEGTLAAHAATGGRPPGRLLTRRAALRRFADRLAHAFPIGDAWPEWLTPDTIVCRCEEVDTSAVTAALSAGAVDARTVKLLSRAGMGLCQGRMCGYAVDRLCGARPTAPRRLIATPVRLADLAALDDTTEGDR